MFKKAIELEHPEVSQLIRDLRQLTALTQEQFANRLGVTYTTINRWENRPMQPSPLALRQIKAVLKELIYTSAGDLQIRSQMLLDVYFPGLESIADD